MGGGDPYSKYYRIVLLKDTLQQSVPTNSTTPDIRYWPQSTFQAFYNETYSRSGFGRCLGLV